MARASQLVQGLRPDRLARRLIELLGPTGGAARQSLVALAFNSLTSFAAGAMLVGFNGTWRRLAPMLILVPAAIGLRGNVFSTLGNRLSTSIHTGTFRVSFKADSVLGQNLLASFSLTAVMSVVLACFAKVLATALGVVQHVSVLELTMVSVVGGMLGSIVVAAATVLLSIGAVRYEWDLDYLVAPTVSTLGDVITIPALWLAAQLIGHGDAATIIGGVVVIVTVGVAAWSWRTTLDMVREIFRESLPVLTAALVLSALAGLVLQKQQGILAELPAIGILQPAFVSSAGALGGILCGRIATNLHLGSVEATLTPGAEARRDAWLVVGLAVPLLVLNSVGAWITALISGSHAAPGFGWVLGASSLASLVTMAFVAALSYYSTIGAWRFNVDPDTFGTPIDTASVDFVGTMSLVVAVVALGLI
ncbi:MAG: magnesium transporter [Acidimicrobiales bacterium]